MSSARLAEERRHILARLRNDGFEFDRQTGSHEQWKKWNPKRVVTVPTYREIKGELLKTIYIQAGWDWKDSLTLNLPKEKVVSVNFASKTPIASCATPTADSKPITPIKKVEQQPVVAAPKKIGRAMWRDSVTVELIAQDFLENPYDTISRFENTWKISSASLYRIKKGIHNKLKPKTVQMLKVAFCNVSPMGMTDLLNDYRTDRESLPALVRSNIEHALPAQKIMGQLPPANQNLPVPAPKTEVEKPRPAPEPAKVAQVSEIKKSDAEMLKEILEVAKQAMRELGIVKIVLPERGAATIHRKEFIEL